MDRSFSRFFCLLVTAWVFLAATISARPDTNPSFYKLGELPTASLFGMSANAQVILGNLYTYENLGKSTSHACAVRFTSGEWEFEYVDDESSLSTTAAAISPDGNTIVGKVDRENRLIPAIWRYENDHWVRTELDADGLPAYATQVSSNGQVVIGSTYSSVFAEKAYVWEYLDGTWVGSYLPAPDGSFFTSANALSSDGSVITGIQRINPYGAGSGYAPIVWRQSDDGWHATLLPSNPADVLNLANDISADGNTVLGERRPGISQVVVWHFNGTAWDRSILPEVNVRNTKPIKISSDGTFVLGGGFDIRDTSGSRLGTPLAWQLKNNIWSVAIAANQLKPKVTGFVDKLTADSRLCLIRSPDYRARIWNLVTGKVSTIRELVANVDKTNAAAGLDFTFAEVQNVGYDAANNSYNISGFAYQGNRQIYWAISGYAPFLTNGRIFAGQQITARLPNHNEGSYKITGLPAGLSYNTATRTISGRPTKTGVFSIRYLSSAGKTRESILQVVPLPSEMSGQKTLTLTSPNPNAAPVGMLTATTNSKGGISGSLRLNNGGKPMKFTGVLLVESSGQGALAYTKNTSATPGISLKSTVKGAPPLKLTLYLTTDGILVAELRNADTTMIGSGTTD
jgi:uncharacterized membrane protein